MKKKLIIAFIVFTTIGVGLFYLLTTGNVGVKYNTVEVKMGQVGSYVQDTGRVSSKNIRSYYANGTSKIEAVKVSLGDHVNKGQLLFKYEDNLDLEVQKVDKQIEALEATYEEALSGTDMARVSNARLQVTEIKTNLDLAIANKERSETLYESGVISLTEMEQAINNLSQLQTDLKIAQNSYNQMVKGISVNLRKKYEAEIDTLLVTKKILERNQENNLIYSQINGIVTALNTFEGDVPWAGTLIMEVQDETKKVLLVDFMVSDAILIKPDMTAQVNDLNLGIKMDNLTVAQVYPKAFSTLSELGVRENRQRVEIGLPRSDLTLPFGLEIETKVWIESPREMVLVPVGAVFQENSIQYVRVLVDGGVVERAITIGKKTEGNYQVVSGLTAGEKVILNYQDE